MPFGYCALLLLPLASRKGRFWWCPKRTLGTAPINETRKITMSEWFDWYCAQVDKSKSFVKFRDRYCCPCCFMPTIGERACYEICAICFWEDDGQDSDDAQIIRGGPNGNYSLSEARENFARYLTMYRPSDEKAFTQGLIRAEKVKIFYTILQKALLDKDEASWQKAILIEQKIHQ
jgi:hypothetical protein